MQNIPPRSQRTFPIKKPLHLQKVMLFSLNPISLPLRGVSYNQPILPFYLGSELGASFLTKFCIYFSGKHLQGALVATLRTTSQGKNGPPYNFWGHKGQEKCWWQFFFCLYTNMLFMCQDENESEDASSDSFLFVFVCSGYESVINEPGPQASGL